MKATGKQRAHPVLFLALSARAETKWLSGPMDGVFAELWHSGGTRDVKYWSGVDGGKGKQEWKAIPGPSAFLIFLVSCFPGYLFPSFPVFQLRGGGSGFKQLR